MSTRGLVALTFAALLAACGGGPSGPEAPAPAPAPQPEPEQQQPEAPPQGGGSGQGGAAPQPPPAPAPQPPAPSPPAPPPPPPSPEPPPPPPEPGPARVTIDLSRQGAPTADVSVIGFEVVRVALHFATPPEPRLPQPDPGAITSCAGSATELRDAPSQVRLAFGTDDARVRIAGLETEREGNVVEVWLLVNAGAYVERNPPERRPLSLPVCAGADGRVHSVVRAVASGRIETRRDASVRATIDVRASDVAVTHVTCSAPGTDAAKDPPQCRMPDDPDDDADPRTRLAFELRPLVVRAD